MISRVISATKYSLLSFRRNPAAAFFTIIFPLLFLVLFGFIFGDQIATVDGNKVKVATFQVPGILTLSIVSATFVNLAMGQVFRRELGQLKRLRGTPMPPLAYILGQVLGAFVIVAIMTVLVTVIGQLLFGVEFQAKTIGVFVISILLGACAFSAMGLAITRLIPNQDAAPAVTNATVFPLYFVSDVFFFSDDAPTWLQRIGDVFPVKPLTQSLQDSFNPFVDTVTVPWGKWAVIAAWGIFGVLVAVKTFRWVPESERR